MQLATLLLCRTETEGVEEAVEAVGDGGKGEEVEEAVVTAAMEPNAAAAESA